MTKLDFAITQIEKQYGKGSIMKLNEEVVVNAMESLLAPYH